MKEKLKKSGLNEEQIKAVMESFADYVPKGKFDEVSGENASLKKKAEELCEKNKALIAEHKAEINALKIENAVDNVLMAAGAKNRRAVKAILQLEGAELCEDGTVRGLDEQIKALKESDGYLFDVLQLKGVAPGESKDGLPGGKSTSEMTYSELAAYMAKNPNAEI